MSTTEEIISCGKFPVKNIKKQIVKKKKKSFLSVLQTNLLPKDLFLFGIDYLQYLKSRYFVHYFNEDLSETSVSLSSVEAECSSQAKKNIETPLVKKKDITKARRSNFEIINNCIKLLRGRGSKNSQENKPSILDAMLTRIFNFYIQKDVTDGSDATTDFVKSPQIKKELLNLANPNSYENVKGLLGQKTDGLNVFKEDKCVKEPAEDVGKRFRHSMKNSHRNIFDCDVELEWDNEFDASGTSFSVNLEEVEDKLQFLEWMSDDDIVSDEEDIEFNALLESIPLFDDDGESSWRAMEKETTEIIDELSANLRYIAELREKYEC